MDGLPGLRAFESGGAGEGVCDCRKSLGSRRAEANTSGVRPGVATQMQNLPRSLHTGGPRRTGDYALCGWRVRSAVELPEVMPWMGDDRAPDLVIRLGAAPPLRDPI